MSGLGGSIESISIRNRLFAVASDADATRKLGGFENEIQLNGDGTARQVKTRVPWMLGGLTVDIDDDRADQEFLKEIQDGKGFVPITITFVSGTTYQAKGQITEAVDYSSQNATASVSLAGPGELAAQ